jgi:ABC-type sugar transport system permease subunit
MYYLPGVPAAAVWKWIFNGDFSSISYFLIQVELTGELIRGLAGSSRRYPP